MIPLFEPTTSSTESDLYDSFIEWARPFGLAGITTIHALEYEHSAPYFSWAASFLAQGDDFSRSWFLIQEYLHEGRSVFTRAKGTAKPRIINPNGLISDGRFLYFAKAYINVMCFYRGLRTPPKPLFHAIAFIEKALRTLNDGDNDPTNLNLRTFELADRYLAESKVTGGRRYDAAKELELMAGMLQKGYQSTNSRFDGKGFRLIVKPFSFSTRIANPPRKKAISNSKESEEKRSNRRLTSEEVAAVGLAYRKAKILYGSKSRVTFMAAIAGLPLTTTSMRVSELISLSRSPIYQEVDGSDRYKLRIYRPKTDEHQNIPLPHKLGELAVEMVECIEEYSRPAHQAFDFYIMNFGDDFDAIDRLYIPEQLREVFTKEYLDIKDLNFIFDTNNEYISQSFAVGPNLEIIRFVNKPNDVLKEVPLDARARFGMLTLQDIEARFKEAGYWTNFPASLDRSLYINRRLARRHVSKAQSKFLTQIFRTGPRLRQCIRTSDLLESLLADFKDNRPKHWPYISKDKKLKFNEVLTVRFAPSANPKEKEALIDNKLWWRPGLLSIDMINRWISKCPEGGPILFEILGIRLKNGAYPSFTVHLTRKYHHTKALLAGAHESFINELAGRESGRQADFYDLRTPHEILAKSLETFDPDMDFEVTGPIADEAKTIKLSDRQAFIYKNAAPKHLTEIGGCTTDWSLNPCEEFGGCTRCDKHVWRKGDIARIPIIHSKLQHALEMIKIGEEKLSLGDPPHSLVRQVQQFKDDIVRCEAILNVEADSSIKAGTLVTFELPAGAMSMSELTVWLRNEQKKANLHKGKGRNSGHA